MVHEQDRDVVHEQGDDDLVEPDQGSWDRSDRSPDGTAQAPARIIATRSQRGGQHSRIKAGTGGGDRAGYQLASPPMFHRPTAERSRHGKAGEHERGRLDKGACSPSVEPSDPSHTDV